MKEKNKSQPCYKSQSIYNVGEDLFQITPVTFLIITNIIKCGGERSGDEIEDHSHHPLHPQKVEEDLVVEKSKIKQVSDDLNAVFNELMW